MIRWHAHVHESCVFGRACRCERGLRTCIVTASNMEFGGDSCVNTLKYLQVNYRCLPAAGINIIIIIIYTTTLAVLNWNFIPLWRFERTVREFDFGEFTGLPWIWNFTSISISISTDFLWISMDIHGYPYPQTYPLYRLYVSTNTYKGHSSESTVGILVFCTSI